MKAKTHRVPRKTSLNWMESRLRRLDYKLANSERHKARGFTSYSDLSDLSLNRCKNRAHQLACEIQIYWGHEAVGKMI